MARPDQPAAEDRARAGGGVVRADRVLIAGAGRSSGSSAVRIAGHPPLCQGRDLSPYNDRRVLITFNFAQPLAAQVGASEDARFGTRAFAEERKPEWKGR